jgi:hypothetical protein
MLVWSLNGVGSCYAIPLESNFFSSFELHKPNLHRITFYLIGVSHLGWLGLRKVTRMIRFKKVWLIQIYVCRLDDDQQRRMMTSGGGMMTRG